MPRSAPSTAHPLQSLRENTESLEASILVCIGGPGKKAVHKLRASTRRVEALLKLLALLSGLPPHKKQARVAARMLKKIRRAAGQVRDLDVQRDLIAAEVSGKNRVRRSSPAIRKEANSLRKELKHQRDRNATRLQHLLAKHHIKFARVFDRLLSTLEPAESLALPEAQLIALTRGWYAHHTPASAPQDHAQLHGIRKHAKLARYLVASAPQSASDAHRLAAQFEELQQAGGHWHDWLLLHQLSTTEFGKSAPLAQRFSAHTRDSLRAYRQRLAEHAEQYAQTPMPYEAAT